MNDNDRFPFRFFIVAFFWSWLFWIPIVLASQGIIAVSSKLLSSITLPVSIVAAFGPLTGALFALHREQGKGSSAKYLRSFLDLRLGWKAYLLSFLVLGGSTALAWFLPEIYGEERLPMLLPSIWLFIPYLLIMIFLGGGQEEFGWRGYALPRLEKQFGLWFANIILGIIWACWHLPLWFITGTSQTYMNFGGFILLTVGYSFIFSWIRDISGNKPFSGLFVHGTANAFIPLMPTLIMQKNIPQPRFWIWVSLTFFVGVLITMFRTKSFHSPK
jgi:uncharacterized protein